MFEEIKRVSASKEDQGDFYPIFSLEDQSNFGKETYEKNLPLLALKNTVLFPGVVIPITVGRDKSLSAIKKAEKTSKHIAVATQRDQKVEEPGAEDIHTEGVVAKVMKVLKMPDGSTTAILQGRSKIDIVKYNKVDPHFEVEIVQKVEDPPANKMEFEAMMVTIRETAKKIIELSPQIPSEANMMLQNINDDLFLLNFIASNLNASIIDKQGVLANNTYTQKAKMIYKLLNKELQLLELKDKIESKVRGDLEKQQRDYFLNQQLKTIQDELGGSPHEQELKELEKRAKDKNWPKYAFEYFKKEFKRTKRLNPQLAEYSVSITHLETLLDLPWNNVSKDNFDLKRVQKILDDDHFGLDEIKKRIVEHLAVLKLKGNMKAPIICLVGPPGVGKTSLGKSIARSLERKFIRMSLGGLHDESEIRGHRKTYIGAMPGRVIKSIKKSGVSNPVFILDEIDKLGRDHRGDPSSALLEVLDPEQNSTFYDNYIDVEYDLSKVLFIATANSLSSIQPALLDRMEIIELSGYSVEEKVQIAKKHLVPKQRKEHGLLSKDLSITDKGLEYLISHYTKESGVRGLDRTIGNVMRHYALKKALEEKYKKSVTEKEVLDILGPIKIDNDKYMEISNPGVAVGLAWTRVGGDILFIEAITSKGKGKLTLTGNLGDVMKESATTALSFIKANAASMDIDSADFEQKDLHIHVPEGAIPKDGPSAGITMLSAIASAMKGKQIKPYLAMTGEITLRGKVLPVGGIKEKVLAANRAGIKEIMLCAENKRHVDKINAEYIKDMKFTYVSTMQEVLENALGFMRF